MAVFWQELVRVQVLACRLAASDKEDVVARQAERVGRDEDGVDHHRKRDTPGVYCVAEAAALLVLPCEQMAQTRAKQE